MKRLFAVISRRRPRHQASLPLERQPDWRAHAEFMNALEAEGFVLTGGPLEGTDEVLLIVRAADEGEVRARLAPDPCVAADLLRLERVLPWTLRLGETVFEGAAKSR